MQRPAANDNLPAPEAMPEVLAPTGTVEPAGDAGEPAPPAPGSGGEPGPGRIPPEPGPLHPSTGKEGQPRTQPTPPAATAELPPTAGDNRSPDDIISDLRSRAGWVAERATILWEEDPKRHTAPPEVQGILTVLGRIEAEIKDYRSIGSGEGTEEAAARVDPR
jgi:hypothetical protein